MAAVIPQYEQLNVTSFVGTKCKSLNLNGNRIKIDLTELVALEEVRLTGMDNSVNPLLDYTTLVNLKSLSISGYEGAGTGTFTLPPAIISNLEKFYMEAVNSSSNTINISSIPLSANIKEFYIDNLQGYSGISLQSVIVLPPTMANCYKFIATSNDLDQTNVDNILLALDANGLTQGICRLDGGLNSPPSIAGAAAAANLTSKGWEVSTM